MYKRQVARYPKFLADHALKHLIDRILNKRGENTANQVLRDELANEIVIDMETLTRQSKPTEAERLQSTVKGLNQTSTLDRILAKKKAEKAHKKEVVKRKEEGEPVVEEKFEGLPDVEPEKPKVEIKPKEPPKVEAKEVVAKPTRKDLMDFAGKEGLVLDEQDKEGKTLRQKLEKMPVDKVIKELNYPVKK